jgi:endonuclease V-like protein UPF0215 family
LTSLKSLSARQTTPVAVVIRETGGAMTSAIDSGRAHDARLDINAQANEICHLINQDFEQKMSIFFRKGARPIGSQK